MPHPHLKPPPPQGLGGFFMPETYASQAVVGQHKPTVAGGQTSNARNAALIHAYVCD
jgi:hypothetical protein